MENTRKLHLYSGDVVEFQGCASCAYANGAFSVPGGNAYADKYFDINQDWELPINGFIVIMPKRHCQKFSELTDFEIFEIGNHIKFITTAFRKLKVCDNFDVIFEERGEPNFHFHVWVMPRHEWIMKKFGNPTKCIADVFKYAKENLKTKENIDEIHKTIEALKNLYMNEFVSNKE